MKPLLALLIVLGALLAGSSASGVGASIGFTPAGIIPHSGASTLTAPRAAAGTGTSCGSISCAAYQAGINGYFQDVAADSGSSTNVYSVATEYSDDTGNVAYDETFGGTYVDTRGFPTTSCFTTTWCVSESDLVTEIQKAVDANGWTEDSSNLYFIFLPANVDTCFDNPAEGCASNAFCAYHHWSGSLIFAVEPFNASFRCNASGTASDPQGFPNGQEIDETLNTVSHEQNEAITDPFGDGWYTNIGYENGDLCAWSFGDPLGTAANGQPSTS
jgi:hypothetical protein